MTKLKRPWRLADNLPHFEPYAVHTSGFTENRMPENVIVQYVGFKVKEIFREYSFLVREAASEAREFTFTIPNEAFDSHRVRYQDGPDICSLKLHRELAGSLNHPATTHYPISETEMDAYRDSHFSKAKKSLYPKKTERGF
jgi:hypothetical protein